MDLIDEWATSMRASGSATTTTDLRLRIMRALIAHAGVDDPLQLTRMHVVSYLGRAHLQPWSRITYWRAIDAWCCWLDDAQRIESGLLAGIKITRRPDPVARPIDDATIGRLLAAPLSERTRAYVTMALFQGLRVHETAKLRGEDFDLGAGYLEVTGKGNVTVQVPVHPEVLALAERMPRQGWWFPSPVHPSRPVRPEAVTNAIGRALQSVGSPATPHRLRDTAATLMQRQRHDLRVTQRFLRHRSVTTTEKYVAVDDEQLRDAISDLWWGEAA